MRKKLIALVIALSAAAAQGLFPTHAQALHCNGFLSCCDGRCVCCSRPCPPAC